MSDISVGAVGAAIIAGLVSLLGLIIGKEQKVSEFRQAWIDDLRKCLVSYVVGINSISDLLRLKKSGDKIDQSELVASYRALNEASHGIVLRVNSDEGPAKELLKSMKEFEKLAKDNESLTPENIRSCEDNFLMAAKVLLKSEWNTVKRGEKIFVLTKRIVGAVTAAMILVLLGLWLARSASATDKEPSLAVRSAAATGKEPGLAGVRIIQSISNDSNCQTVSGVSPSVPRSEPPNAPGG